MAKTFTLNSDSYDGRYMQLYCEQTTDIDSNKSTISWTLSSIGGDSNYYSTGPTTVVINGVQVYYKSRVSWDAKAFPAAKGSESGTLTVDHNGDGSKSISVNMTTAVYYGKTSSYSGTWILDSIPRQALITAAYDFTDQENPIIYFSNPGGFEMDVWLEPNPVGERLCENKDIPNTGSYTWSLTEEEIEALRNSCAGTKCTIRVGLRSYVGVTQYEDYKDKTFTIEESDATRPKVSMGISLNNNFHPFPENLGDIYIQGKSQVDVTLSAEGEYDATIKSYSATVDGKTYSSSEFTSDVIQKAGKVDIVGYAVDSRGFTGSTSKQINVVAYSKPSLINLGNENAILCYRSDSNGNRTGNSTSVWLKAKMLFSSVSQKNTCSFEWRRKLVTEEWGDDHVWLSLNTTTDEYNALIPAYFDKKTAYTVQIRAIDYIGEQDVKTFEIPTEDVALHLGKGGTKVAVGTYCGSEDYTFYSAWKAIFDNDVVVGGDILIGPNKTTLRDYILSVIEGG